MRDGGDDRIVGRQAERIVLERFLDDIARGRAALLLEGEVGIGKTELWTEGSRRAEARSYRVLSCRPDDAETDLAFSALGDLLDGVWDEVIPMLEPLRRRALETALLRGEGGERFDRRAVSIAMVDALRTLSAASPVLLAIDDVQWLDRASADVLRFTLRRVSGERLGLLATARDGLEEPERFLGFAPVERMRVTPLDEEDLEAVLRARLGTSFLRPTLRQLYENSGGNPFFALELARARLRRSAAPSLGEPPGVPSTLRGLVEERLAGLPEPVRAMLVIVASLSHASVALVEAAAGSDVHVAGLLSAAVEAGVLDVERGRLRFAHPLLRAVVYREAAEGTRRDIHRTLAGVVSDPEDRARHLALSTDLPDAEVAAALEAASRRAGARGATEAAGGFAEQAFRLTQTEHADDAVRRAIAASDFLWDSGETGRARKLLDELAAMLSAGQERARILRRLARVEAYERGWDPAIALLEQALVEAGGNATLRAAAERDLGMVLTQRGELRRAASHARVAAGLADGAGAGPLRIDARATLDAVEFMLGNGPPPDLRERVTDRLADDETELERHPAILQRAMTWAAMLKWTDDFDTARTALEQLHSHIVDRQEEALLSPVLFHLGELECWAGNFAVARRWAIEMEQATLRAGQSAVRAQSLYLTALVDALVGRADEARAHAMEGLARAEQSADVRVVVRNLKVLGFLELSRGHPPLAETFLTRATEMSESAGYGDPGFFRLDADAIEALIATGEVARAARQLATLEERGARLGRAWALATGWRCRALINSARGAPEQALLAIERSLAEHERLPDPLELGRTLLVAGMIQRRVKQKRLARTSLERALDLFEQLGTPLWAERARAEAARISGRAPATPGLTQTERRVAERVAAGRTNKEVAAELYLSVKAVEANLSKIYRKLGIRSRTELARALPESVGVSPLSPGSPRS